MSSAAPSQIEITKKSKAGILSLSMRSVLIYGLQTVSLLVLSKWLSPRDYGIFGIINGWIGVSFYFADAGLTGALIRQQEEPSRAQMESCMAVQLLIGAFFFVVFWTIAPWISSYAKLGHEATVMIRVLAIALPLSSLRVTARVHLDRQLKFGTQARVELIEAVCMYVMQITLAISGFGAWSLVAASLVRAFTGTVLFQLWTRQFFAPIFHWREVKKLLPYGLPFQANAALPALRGLVLPLVLGSLLPVEKVGLITWSVSLASIPMLLAYNYNHVTFPSLAKLQGHVVRMRDLASRGLEVATLIFGALFGIGAACGVALITWLFDNKWADAKTIFHLAIFSVSLGTIRYLAASVMNASGVPGRRLAVELSAVAAEFALVAVLARFYGIEGYFTSTIIVNFVALLATALIIKPMLRAETARRFVVTVGAAALPFFVLRMVHLEVYLFPSLTVFVVCFFGVLFIGDPSARTDCAKLLNETLALVAAKVQSSRPSS